MKAGPKKSMRVLGGRNLPPARERFDRLQRTAQLLAGGTREPRGVYRFQSWEEFDEWKMRYQIQAAPPTPPTS